MAPIEPQDTADYDDRTTAAVRSVLLEIGQSLGSFHGKFAVIGGAVPWLLLEEAEMPHVGTGDVDLSLDAEVLVTATSPLLDDETAKNGYLGVSKKFRHMNDFGPVSVRRFVENSELLGERTADQCQQDAFGQINAWLTALGLK